MNKHELIHAAETLLEETKTAVLATVDQECKPHIRWVIAGFLKERTGAIYAVSGSKFSKIEQILHNPHVEMMIQSAALDRIVNVRGVVNILDNPSIRGEALEALGSGLAAFWRANIDESEIVVLELVIEEISFYKPMEGIKVTEKIQ